MKKFLWLLAVIPSIGTAQISFEESEGFSTGASAIPGWSGEFTVFDQEAFSGAQSLKISQAIATNGEAAPVTYADFWVKASADSSEDPAATIDFGGAAIAFLREGTNGAFYAFNATGNGTSSPVLQDVALDASGHATEWTRITIRRDFANRKWDLFCNGRPVAWGMGLDAPSAGVPQVKFSSPPDGELFVDDFGRSSLNPLFTDTDNDGIPDAYEEARGMNPRVDDRLGDANHDGVPNFAEFVHSLSGTANTQGASDPFHIVYVDKNKGNDSNAGSYPYPVEGDGPKASIHAAIEAAKEGDTIAVIEGVYDEGEISLAGKPFNLITVGKVKF